MQEKIRIENLQEPNIGDLVYVCSSKRLGDPIHEQGIRLKRQWLLEMLAKYGSCAKIAYYNRKPAAQILYYPEEADVTKAFKRKNVLVINCIYNPTPEAHKLGIGTRLLQAVIRDVKERKTCKFILAKAFNTGELLPLPEFYKKNGFLSTQERNLFYFPIEGSYEPTKPLGEYEPLPEDRNKAIIFYGPTCEFSYPFAKKIEGLVKEVAPNMKIEIINEWEKPEETIKRKNWWLVVNARPIQTFFMETEKFKEEIVQAVSVSH
ncbi:MAG: GNAT family N-acetyltransferase [Candidatus Bathyarchaeota archaeon]|nr:GNAT family N-acetyltransferase [Candidatus Bathyarchaeota archaeon]MDH5787344.1 GNAT family N-acetyltransferase [Candidatus Bathyarchaeota archaeon]